MSTTIQIRNVPENIHRMAKARAAMRGMTMSAYVLGELEKALSRPTREKPLNRVARTTPTMLENSAADLIPDDSENH